jgi:lipoyl(octanoyl) transferase
VERVSGDHIVEWAVSPGLTPYHAAVAAMEQRAGAIHRGAARELVWLVEHPPLYTSGSSAKDGDVLDAQGFPVIRTGRGGETTYHGPGQRVAYVMLDLAKRGRDVRGFVRNLEEWLIRTLAEFSVTGERRQDRIGVWVDRTRSGGGLHEDKIAAIGVRIRRWVSFHGVALNVEPDLSHYRGIVPCGVRDPRYGVTSLVNLGLPVGMEDADLALRRTFPQVFGGALADAPPPATAISSGPLTTP